MKAYLNITTLKTFFTNNKNKTVIFLMAVFILGTVILGDDKNEYNIERTFRYSFTLQNKTNTILKNVGFWVYAPVKKTSVIIPGK